VGGGERGRARKGFSTLRLLEKDYGLEQRYRKEVGIIVWAEVRPTQNPEVDGEKWGKACGDCNVSRLTKKFQTVTEIRKV